MKSFWTTKEVEDYLRELPSIEDSQSKEELYLAIEAKMKEQSLLDYKDEKRIIIKKKRFWQYPSYVMASLVAICLLIIISPSFIRDWQDSAGDMNVTEVMEGGVEDTANRVSEIGGLEVAENYEEPLSKRGLYIPVPYTLDVDMAGDSREFHTFIVREDMSELNSSIESILLDLLTSHPSTRNSVFDGLQNIIFDKEYKTVTLDFSEEYGMASLATGEMNTTTTTIMEVFSLYGMEEVRFTLNGESGIKYGGTGFVEGFDLLPHNRGYYLYEGYDGTHYFIRGVAVEEGLRNTPEQLLTFPETLEKMKRVQPGAWYQPAIPETVQITVEEEGRRAVISLQVEDVKNPISENEFERLIEAIQLAASDFYIEEVMLVGSLVYELTNAETLLLTVPSIRLPD